MSKHTPGPWKYVLNVGPTKAMIVEEDGSAILDVSTVMGHRGELEANCRVICKAPIAPKLAEALRRAIAALEFNGIKADQYATVGELRAALAEWEAQS